MSIDNSPPRKRRGLRFNLSLLFVGVTILAVPLGWRALQMREAERERAALAASIGQMPYVVVGKERAAHVALKTVDDFKFVQTPLDDVATSLSKRFGAPIELDPRGLDDAGLGAEIPITFDAKQIKLEEFLRQVLRNLELVYVVETTSRGDAVILITTPERLAESSFTKVYNVGDLTEGKQTAAELAKAIDVVYGDSVKHPQIANSRWRIGGFGDVLIVRGSAAQHDEVGRILRDIKLGVMAKPLENR